MLHFSFSSKVDPCGVARREQGHCIVLSGFSQRKSQKINKWGVGIGRGRFNGNGFWLVMQMSSSIQGVLVSHPSGRLTTGPSASCGRENSPRPLIMTLTAGNEIHQIANLVYDRSGWRIKALRRIMAAQKPQPWRQAAAGTAAVKTH